MEIAIILDTYQPYLKPNKINVKKKYYSSHWGQREIC